VLREYAGAAKRTALSGDITDASTNITVADATGYPTGATAPFVIAFSLGQAVEEKVLIASRSGNTLTVAAGGRGFDGTTAAAHSAGATVDHVLVAIDIRETNAHVYGTGQAHTNLAVTGDLTLNTASLPRGVRAFRNDMGSTADLGDNVLVPGYALPFAAEAGRLYRVMAAAGVVDDQAGTTGTFAGAVDLRIRSENAATAVGTTSPIRGVQRVPLTGNSASNAHSLLAVGYINNPPAGNVNVALTGHLLAPGTLWRILQAVGEGSMIVEDIGAAR
jgi:hypothetical protein